MRLRSWKRAWRLAGAIAVGVAGLLASPSADAHFRLVYPPQWIEEANALGDPQKAGPCGVDSQISYTATHKVTSFAPGQTITLHFTETVPHDGWYRISISYANRADLTDPPYQTYASGGMAGWSEDAGIEDPPVPPVLVDGLFKHSMASTSVPKDYTYDLTLPTKACAKCTLQIEQIMLNHPVNRADGKFTYHHCADITIVDGADGGTAIVDSGPPVSMGGLEGGSPEPGGSSGSSGSIGSSSSGASNGDSDAAGLGSSGGANTDAGNGSSSYGSGSSGSAGGCNAAGRGATAAAGLGLLVGAIGAGLRRRRTVR